MLQYTYLSNGDIQVTCDTGDALLTEMVSQFKQQMVYAARSFVPRTIYTNTMRLAVTHQSNAPTLENSACQIYEISPISRKIVARDAESFFSTLSKALGDGYEYSPGSAVLTFGAYAAVLTKVSARAAPQEAVTNDIPTFDLSYALCLQTKEEVIDYCLQFGIQIDGRKSLPKIQNWLEAQSQ